MHHLTGSVTIQSEPSARIVHTNGGERKGPMQFPSVVGGRLWTIFLTRNGDLGGHDSTHPNPDVDTNDARAQSHSNSSWELKVPRGFVAGNNPQSTFEEAEKGPLKDEEDWLLQQSFDIDEDVDGENNSIYETMDDMTPSRAARRGRHEKECVCWGHSYRIGWRAPAPGKSFECYIGYATSEVTQEMA